MCGTKTCEKYRFLMRKGTKMALKPMVDIMIILRSTQSSTNRHKLGPVTRFYHPYYPIDKGSF